MWCRTGYSHGFLRAGWPGRIAKNWLTAIQGLNLGLLIHAKAPARLFNRVSNTPQILRFGSRRQLKLSDPVTNLESKYQPYFPCLADRLAETTVRRRCRLRRWRQQRRRDTADISETLVCAVDRYSERKGARCCGSSSIRRIFSPSTPSIDSSAIGHIFLFLRPGSPRSLPSSFPAYPAGSPPSRSISNREISSSSARARQISTNVR
jgi:hypothetical protein